MHRLGQLLAAKGDHLAAMRWFKALTGLRPDLFKPWLCLAQCCEALNREFDAANAYREVVRIRPDSTEAFSGLARLLIKRGKLEEVNSSLVNALAASVSLPDAGSNFRASRMRLQ
jgi:Flp pilus assembly protein TadD